ncbi:MAG: 2-C-methyl-D-erythritol 4-phosphate cytidylyltransferase [Gemmatimonas sp.]|nr:2-C-methyl-D-erythritol 4-phosphate cytidylyltransferase [Gemmatimonas sp.]
MLVTDRSSRIAVIVVAAGSGRRFGESEVRKQYLPLRGIPLLAWSVAPFLEHPRVDRVTVVVPPEDMDDPPHWLRRLPLHLVGGGCERADSVRAGAESLDEFDRVLVHDGARPLASRSLIDRVIAADPRVGVVPGIPVADTLKEVDETGNVSRTPDRRRFLRIQTPQAFPFALFKELHDRARIDGIVTTDDAGLFERYGHTVHVIEGDMSNLKVTTSFDLSVAELLAQRLPLPAL